jgi:ABC-2 type transport system permease protein
MAEAGAAAASLRLPGLAAQTRQLILRHAGELASSPAQLLLPVGLAIGFILIQDALLGGSRALASEAGGSYFAFILPAGLLIAGAASGLAGYMVAQDVESGYLDRLFTMPVSRAAIVLAPILTGVLLSIAVAAIVLAFGAAAGSTPVTGPVGALAMLLLAACWGAGVAGYMVATGLLARDVSVVRLVELSAFFLLFLSPILLTRETLSAWVQPIATVNPTTYVVEALRDLMLHGWRPERLLGAFAVALGFAAATLTAAALAARRAATRK